MVEIVPCWRGLWDRKVQKLTALFRNPSAELMQFTFFHLGYLNRNKGDIICWLIRDRWACTHPLAGYISPSFGPPIPRASGREALVLLRKRKIPPHLLHVGKSPPLSSSYPWHRAYSPSYPTPWITIIQIKKLHWPSKEASNLCLFMREKAFESQKVLKKCRCTIQSCSGSSPHRIAPHMWHPTSNFTAFPHQLGMLSHQPSSLSMGMKRRIQLSQEGSYVRRWDETYSVFCSQFPADANTARPNTTLAQHPWAWKFSDSVTSLVKWTLLGLEDCKIWSQNPVTCSATLWQPSDYHWLAMQLWASWYTSLSLIPYL